MFSDQGNTTNELFNFQSASQFQPQPQPSVSPSYPNVNNQGYSGPTGPVGQYGQSGNSGKNDDLQEVMALWAKTAKSGKPYYAGKDNNGNEYVGFVNDNKKNPNEPDIRISVRKKK